MPRIKYIKSYRRKDGTLVSPHIRTTADGNPYNNIKSPTPKQIQDYLDKKLGLRKSRRRRRR
jgi:hypothetical protein